MTNELLTVVDQLDQNVESLPRNIVHSRGLIHRAVHILVFNAEGHLFLQKRSMKKDSNQGLWDTSAAGHVDAGEEYEQSALREVEEELGITPNANRLIRLFKLDPKPQLGMEFVQVFQLFHDGAFALNQDEIDEGAWFSTHDISDRVKKNDQQLTETFKVIWKRYVNGKFKLPKRIT